MENLLAQLQELFGEYLPSVATAAGILAGGWVAARVLRAVSYRLLQRTTIDDKIAKWLGQDDPEQFNRFIVRWVNLITWLIALWFFGRTIMTIHPVADFVFASQDFINYLASLPVVIFGVDLALTALVTLVLVRVVGLINLGFERLHQVVDGWRKTRIKSVRIQRVELLTADRLTDLLLILVNYLRLLVIFLAFLLYLSVVFSFFPQTRGFVSGLLDSIFGAISRGWQSFIDYLPSLVNLVIIIILTRYAIRFLGFIFDEIEKGTITFAGFYPEWAQPTYQLVRFLVMGLALVIAFPFLPGSASPAFQGISIFIGALFSLGSSSVVANLVAGVVLTYTRAFTVGDRVKIADTIGDVMEKTLLITRVRTIKNVDVTIPNGMVLSSHIINYSSSALQEGLVLHTTITLGYDIPWRKVHQVLVEAAGGTKHIQKKPVPYVLQTSLDDFYVSYELNATTDQPNKMAEIYSDLHQNIQDKCNQAGIEILSPHFEAIRDGSQSTVPKG